MGLPGKQLQLLQTVASAAGKGNRKLVVVSVNAGMLDLSWAKSSAQVSAVLNCIYLGMAAGTAIADTLVGKSNPAGRLPITYYQSISDIGTIDHYRMHPTADSPGRTYRYYTGPVIYPFGFGLSYSQFKYDRATLTPGPAIAPCDGLEVSVVVHNTGGYTGDEVVQLYLSIRNSTVIVANSQLVAFQRVAISRGGSQRVTFRLSADDNAVMRDGDFKQVIEPGVRQLWVGGSSSAAMSPGAVVSFLVTGKPTLLSACKTAKTAA